MTDAPFTDQNEQDRRDILVARVVDGEATSEDWRELRTIAASDQSIWAEIAEQQDLKRELDVAVEDAVSVAERVALPMHEHASVAPNSRIKLALTAGGWLAAACVGIAWIVGMTPQQTLTPATSGAPQNIAMPNPINTAAEALAKYLELGQASGEVLGEMPSSVVIQRTPNPEGGYDVIYLRQIVEKTTVDGVYEAATDDTGNTFFVPKSSTTQAKPAEGDAPLPAVW
ncbi:MAG: hypothetical protein AAFO89_14440 [Planctomycetota bacterium]